MRARHYWLAGLLAAQLALALVIFRGAAPGDRAGERQPLLPAAATEVDRIVISRGDGHAELVRDEHGWHLPGLADLPADAGRVNAELDRIAAIETGWPVTDTAGSHARFEVDDEGAQRHLQLYRGDTVVADFYLGTSPGFREVHLRRAGDDPVYAVELSVNDLPADSGEWLDRTLLAVSDATRITGGDYTLVQSPGQTWALAAPPQGGASEPPATDQTRVQQLVHALANLQVQGVADAPPEPGTVTVLQVATPGGELEFSFYSADDQYYVRRSDLDRVFTLSRYDYDRITGVGLAQLVAAPAPSSPGQGAQPPAGEGPAAPAD